MFLDLKKAFDLVDRQILLKKMEILGFRGVTNKFFKSYLTNRKQYMIGGSKSNISDVSHGVPQGSILGPMLFNLYINDIVRIQNCKIILFADDTVIYITSNAMNEAIAILKSVIKHLENCFFIINLF